MGKANKTNLIVTQCCLCGNIIKVKEAPPNHKGGVSHGECNVCHSFRMIEIDVFLEKQKLSPLADSPVIQSRIEKLDRKTEVIKSIYAFRKWSVENRGLKIKFAQRGR